MFEPTGMHKYSDIDELINFTYKARQSIINNQEIMSLLADVPNIDLDSEDADDIVSRVKDHDYIDETCLKANSYIIIESEILNLDTQSMKSMALYVQIVCSKSHMDISPKLFPGVKGNRRDNIARLVNNVLSDDLGYGIGGLKLTNATIASVPTGYTSRLLTYKVPSFA